MEGRRVERGWKLGKCLLEAGALAEPAGSLLWDELSPQGRDSQGDGRPGSAGWNWFPCFSGWLWGFGPWI